jgi:carbohydrate diacid regulator
MLHKFLDARLAQEIVSQTMSIIDCNVNIMDSNGYIIASGDPERIGELHEAALLALSHGRSVDVNDELAKHLQGVKIGVNLPLRVKGEIVGIIGLTGEPSHLQQYGKLVCMTAEMMLEQTRLLSLLAQDSRLREELVLNLIRSEAILPEQRDWAQRLGIDLAIPRVVAIIEIDSGHLGGENALAELQQLQEILSSPDKNNLIATVSLTEMVVLKPALNNTGQWEPERIRRRMDSLLASMNNAASLTLRAAVGNYFTGEGSIARSYRTACTTLQVGKLYHPELHSYYYQDLMLPVLLDSLRGGWQTSELVRPIHKLKVMDSNGLLRRTLMVWFKHNTQLISTAKALYIHRNTLEYRLNRVAELTGLNIRESFDDRLLLYIALQMDETS